MRYLPTSRVPTSESALPGRWLGRSLLRCASAPFGVRSAFSAVPVRPVGSLITKPERAAAVADTLPAEAYPDSKRNGEDLMTGERLGIRYRAGPTHGT